MSARILFHAWGHHNISALHKTTLEFTKDADVTPEGDCIIGVNADFDSNELQNFVKQHDTVRITLKIDDLKEVINAQTNPDFSDDRELVIRMGEHVSPRTFAVRADKSAKYLSRDFVKKLQSGSEVEVYVEAVE